MHITKSRGCNIKALLIIVPSTLCKKKKCYSGILLLPTLYPHKE